MRAKLFVVMIAIGLVVATVWTSWAKPPTSSRSRDVMQRVTPTIAEQLAKQNLTLGSPVFIRIFKQPGELELWVERKGKFQLFRRYPVCAVSGKLGPKLKEGDMQAPEGCYFVVPSQMNPNSQYHLAFNLGYPNAYDRAHGRTGSALMVHGSCASIGCYAMGDKAIEEIWTLCSRALDNGQPFFRVHCFPFPLTEANINSHRDHQWIEFWRELKPIYDHFETNGVPPDVGTKDKRYVLNPTAQR
jgi:murein L,D-transpeptidase YafK